MPDKPAFWIGSARHDLRAFPKKARQKAGVQLRAVQRGESPADFKPMPAVGRGVFEIRVRTDDAYRIFYVARFKEVVYVLHAFQKKTQKTSKQDIKLGQQRYKQMLHHRQGQPRN
ncbi:MAG: type II toxin-antitoxin system RelE/ParE family toxin [Bacteroidetes bacterium]|nr:type II toxin-antitoxin system RelE/ParE family toxin [Bacteroidota bacterium]MCH8030371.1 type II toxin-antitoxin system RelE/ParE family toxin [Bacteroidota bacterium]